VVFGVPNAGSLSSNPSSVTWTPLTDTQPTLAVRCHRAATLQPQLTTAIALII